jgi:hypothetical protein
MTIVSRRAFRTLAITLGTLAVLLFGAAAVPGLAGAQTPPTCSSLTNIRVGRHVTYDRVVLDFCGPGPSSFRGTWTTTLVADGSGKRVSLPGNKFVSVVSQNETAWPTYVGPQKFTTPALRNVRAVAITGDFEGYLTIGLGMRHRTWLHVFTLANPSRLVIDVGR